MGYVSTPAYMSRDDAQAAGEQPLLLDGLDVRRYEIPAAGGVIQLVVADESSSEAAGDGLRDLEDDLGFFEALPALIQGVTALGTTAYGAYAARKERKAASADASRAEAAATKQAELAAKQAEAQQRAAEAQKAVALAAKPAPFYKNPLVLAGAVVAIGALGFTLWRMRRKG